MKISGPQNHIFTLEHWLSPFSSRKEPELNLSTRQKLTAAALASAAFGVFFALSGAAVWVAALGAVGSAILINNIACAHFKENNYFKSIIDKYCPKQQDTPEFREFVQLLSDAKCLTDNNLKSLLPNKNRKTIVNCWDSLVAVGLGTNSNAEAVLDSENPGRLAAALHVLSVIFKEAKTAGRGELVKPLFTQEIFNCLRQQKDPIWLVSIFHYLALANILNDANKKTVVGFDPKKWSSLVIEKLSPLEGAGKLNQKTFDEAIQALA